MKDIIKKVINTITYERVIVLLLGVIVGMTITYYKDSVTLKTMAPSTDCTSKYAMELNDSQIKMCRRMFVK